MKKILIAFIGVLIIAGGIFLGNSLEKSGSCTCGGSSLAYRPRFFFSNIQYYFSSHSQYLTRCEPTAGCILREFPIFVDINILGLILIIAPLLKKKH